MPGTKDLATFRSDLDSQLGNRGFGNTLFDQWVNESYLELTGGIRFPELLASFTVATVSGTVSYAGPTDSIGWEVVYDETNDQVLERIDRHDFYRQLRTVNNTPEFWMRDQDRLFLSPTPDAVISERILHIKQPTLLAASTAKTVIPAHWDYAIELLALSRGHAHAVEEDRSAHTRNLAINYIQSRMTEKDFMFGQLEPVRG